MLQGGHHSFVQPHVLSIVSFVYRPAFRQPSDFVAYGIHLLPESPKRLIGWFIVARSFDLLTLPAHELWLGVLGLFLGSR